MQNKNQTSTERQKKKHLKSSAKYNQIKQRTQKTRALQENVNKCILENVRRNQNKMFLIPPVSKYKQIEKTEHGKQIVLAGQWANQNKAATWTKSNEKRKIKRRKIISKMEEVINDERKERVKA